MSDTITNIGNSSNSIIQHGKFNDRIYLMNLAIQDFPNIIEDLDNIALERGYSKIFAKVPVFAKKEFGKHGYIEEAYIPKFYNGDEDAYFMGKYFSKLRLYENKIKEINEILDTTKTIQRTTKSINKNINYLPSEFDYLICNKSHIYKIADMYKKVFKAYPFPIDDPQYIAKTMDENLIYFSIQKNHDIIALSSSEIYADYQNAEMTDFATLPEYQGKGFALYLLNRMEEEMKKRDIKTVYTISRALSYGANIIFAKMGYKYGGILFNNTKISVEVSARNFESMNAWYRFLSEPR